MISHMTSILSIVSVISPAWNALVNKVLHWFSPKCPLSWALVHVSDKSEILTKQQQNLVHYCSKGDKELEGRWVGFFVDNVPVVEN